MSDEAKPSSNEGKTSSNDAASAPDAASHSGEGASSTEAPTPAASGDLAYEHARLAYTIIQALLEHTRVTQDLVALMAQVLSEDTQDALVNTPHWAAYMDSRRVLEHTRADIEKFAQVWTRLSEELSPPDAPSVSDKPEAD
jgi:hypothetical protein